MYDQTAAAGPGKILADLRWISAMNPISSVSRISMVNSAKWMTKRAGAMESFCSSADKSGATRVPSFA